ncbi:MAG: pyruvate formate lyase family protein [Candidatus Bathyarchaeota archaeon]
MSGRVSQLLERHIDLRHTEYRTYSELSIWDHGVDPSDPIVVRKAKALKLLLDETPAIIMDNELVVGLRTLYGQVAEGENILRGTYMLPVNPATDHKKAFYASYLTEEESVEARSYSILEGSYTSHVPFGTAMVLELGIGGVKEKALKRIGPSNSSAQNDFLKAEVICFDAISDFIGKHAEETQRLSEASSDEARKQELFRVSDSIRRITEGPAKSFHDAVQLFWLCTVVMAVESQGCLPIGRLDYDLWPYLKADLDSGAISLDDAQELVDCLWIKLNFETDLTSDSCRNVTIGGTHPDGSDSTNELSYMFMAASDKLRLADPKLNVRFHEGSPERLWSTAVELIKSGLGGFPAFYCDEAIIESLLRMDMSIEDARSYSCDGCQEIIIPGKGDFYPVHTAVNLLECVQRTVGVEPAIVDPRVPKVDYPEPSDYPTFNDFFNAYLANMDALIVETVKDGNKRDTGYGLYSPVPFLSATLEGCIENASDKTTGGCTYNWTGCNGQAFATTVNSLAAVKKMVYDENLVTISGLREQLLEDWPDERLRQYALNRVPKWGNDDDYVDDIAVKVAEHFLAEAGKYDNPRGGPYYPGIFTFHHVSRGIRTSASPDGRVTGDTVSTHISPQAGTDRAGPTRALNSALKVTGLRPPEGTAMDFRLHPSAVSGEEGTKKLRSFIETLMQEKGPVVQFNVIDTETLRKAQADPDQYRSLLVRVWGFSAYFTTLTKEYQEEIIARTVHGLN